MRDEYTLEGRDRISQWLATLDAPVGPLRSNLFARTIIALMLDDDAERLLDVQRAEHTDRMRKLRKAKREGSLADILLADHALFHIEADLRRIDLTASPRRAPWRLKTSSLQSPTSAL